MMKFITIHYKTASITYRNSICSFSAFCVFILTLLSVVIPIYLVTVLSPHSGVSNSRIIYEQPRIEFKYDYILVAESTNDDWVMCSSFNYFNKATKEFQACSQITYIPMDNDYDYKPDKIQIEFDIDANEEFDIGNFFFVLFLDSCLQQKCLLKPPAVVIVEVEVPLKYRPNMRVILNGQLNLQQTTQFYCPYYGRSIQSNFYNEILTRNASTLEEFKLETIREKIRLNPGYFELQLNEKYFQKRSDKAITIQLNLDINEVPVRYHMSIWERLGQFWLYFASFFGVSFYVCNKIKDVLFGRYMLRAWEVIPWKKMN